MGSFVVLCIPSEPQPGYELLAFNAVITTPRSMGTLSSRTSDSQYMPVVAVHIAAGKSSPKMREDMIEVLSRDSL